MCTSSHESPVEKKLWSQSFKLSQNAANSISFDMKKFNAIVIAARFRLDSLERCMYSQKWLGFWGQKSVKPIWGKKIENNWNNNLWWQCIKTAKNPPQKIYVQSQLYQQFNWSKFWTWQAQFDWKMCNSTRQKCSRKKTTRSKSFRLSQNVAYSIAFIWKV